MTQNSLWPQQQQASEYTELCSALFEREVLLLSELKDVSVAMLQSRLKSLPYYVSRIAHSMIDSESPLELDCQNATWATKQSRQMPLSGQSNEDVWQWYEQVSWHVGLVVPIKAQDHFILDCIDRVDKEKNRFRTNIHGWFSEQQLRQMKSRQLCKPTKRVMMAACAGHRWQDNKMKPPVIPSMRELLLSCTINWRNFKRPLSSHRE